MAQWLTNLTRNHEVESLIPGLAQWVKDLGCHELWCRSQMWLGSRVLWLWHRLVTTAPTRPLAWEPPYAAGAAPEKAKRHTQKKLIPHVKSHGSFIISAQGFESASWQSTAGDGIKDCTATGWVKTEDPPWGGPRYGVVVGRGIEWRSLKKICKKENWTL